MKGRLNRHSIPMTLSVSREKLILAINEYLDKEHRIPSNAEVTVRVPGGGDWSNTELNICGEQTIDIKWTVVQEEQEVELGKPELKDLPCPGDPEGKHAWSSMGMPSGAQACLRCHAVD